MNSDLQEAIAGAPVLVKLGQQEYPLAFPIQAVILYKKETAALDRQRAQDRRQQGIAKLTSEELRDLRRRRQKLLTETQALNPGKGQKWDAENYAQADALLDEATQLKCAIDEERGEGDSLYDLYNWRKISPDGDPERLLLALWTGLHRHIEGLNGKVEYKEWLTQEVIGQYIHPGNAVDLTLAISKALAAHIVAPPEVEDEAAEEAPIPNVQTPALPAETMRDPELPASRMHPWKKRES